MDSNEKITFYDVWAAIGPLARTAITGAVTITFFTCLIFGVMFIRGLMLA